MLDAIQVGCDWPVSVASDGTLPDVLIKRIGRTLLASPKRPEHSNLVHGTMSGSAPVPTTSARRDDDC